MNKRTATGLCLAVALGILVFARGWYLRAAWLILMAAGIYECYEALKIKGLKPIRLVGFGFAAAALPCYLFLGGEAGILTAMGFFLCLGMGAVLLTGKPDLPRAAATVLPVVYPGMLFCMVFPLIDIPDARMSALSLVMLFVIPLMGDVGAFLVGSKMGRHKLSPEVSPHKTVEGALGGLACSVAFAMAFAQIAGRLTSFTFGQAPLAPASVGPAWHFALLGLVGSAFAQFGDLTASMIKRYCGVKDYGNVFPGHGGVLDRFDSVLFMSVVTYVYFVLLRG